MQPDLLHRARSASTLEEECAVIDGLLSKALAGELNVPHLGTCAILALSGTVGRVLEYGLPRPVLLGVVAALRPNERGFEVAGTYDGKRWGAEYCNAEVYAPTPALALLIAILEAGNG